MEVAIKIKLIDIPEEGGRRLTARENDDPWLPDLAHKAFGEDYPQGGKARLNLNLLKTCGNVQIEGEVEVDLKPTCDRCLEPFDRHLSIPMEMNLSPVEETPDAVPEEEVELEAEDLNFAFYKGDAIDISDIVRELLVLEIPIRDLCSPTCKGLCPLCGQNLNHRSCSCRRETGDPRLAVLKTLKLPK